MFKKIILPLILILLLSPTFSFAAKELDADNDGKIDSNLLPIDTTTTLGVSDTKIPSQNAVKIYSDTKAPINDPTFTGAVKGIISGTTDNCVKIGADGSIVDAGDVCGSGSGTGDITQSGSPANHYWAYFTADKTLTGVAITASKPVCSDANGNPAVCAGTEGVWQIAGSYIASTALDDTKGNGDTAYFWSADKSYDELALKLGTTDKAADADKLDNHDSTYFQVDLGFVKGTMTDGKYCTYTASGTVLNCDSDAGSLAPGTAYQVYHTNSGATAGEWTSTIGAAGTPLTAGYFTDIYAASFHANKVSGTAGHMGVYEANSTDTYQIGWLGPASISESVWFQFSNNQPTAGQVMLFGAPSGSSGPNGEKVSAQTWGTPVLEGTASGGLLFGDSSPDTAGEMGYDGELKYYDAVGSKTVATVGGALGTPSFTALNMPSSNSDPSTTAGQIKHDSTDSNAQSDGSIKVFTGNHVNTLVSATAVADDSYTIITKTEYIPIGYAEDGAAAPATATVWADTRKARVRVFAADADDDVEIHWMVPDDYVGGIKFRAIGFVDNATAPANTETVILNLAGCSVGNSDDGGCTLGTGVTSTFTADATYAQHDRWSSAWSNEITVTDIAAGESAMLKLFRDVDDTYGQGIGVAGIEIKYKARVLMGDRY